MLDNPDRPDCQGSSTDVRDEIRVEDRYRYSLHSDVRSTISQSRVPAAARPASVRNEVPAPLALPVGSV